MTEYKVMLQKEPRRPYLVKEKEVEYGKTKRMVTQELIVAVMNEMYHLEDAAEEMFYMLTFNRKMDVTGVFQIGHGDVSSCIASQRDIFTRALLAGAAVIILVHNHPSGDPTPSDPDKALTVRAATAGKLLQIQVADHIVIGNGSYYSFKEMLPDSLVGAKIECDLF